MTIAFGIDFDDAPKPFPDGFEEGFAWAVVKIGDFREQIIIPIEYWTPVEYYSQWHEACNFLLMGKRVSVFLVDVRGNWSAMDKSFAWVAYAEDSIVYIRNILLWPQRFPQAGFHNAHLAAPRRTTRSVKPPVSEWRTNLDSIAAFAAQLEARLRNEQKQ